MISDHISRRSQKRILMLSAVLINKTMKLRYHHMLTLIILFSFTFYCRTCLAAEQKSFHSEANGYSVALAEGWMPISMESPAHAIPPTLKFFGFFISLITLFLPFAIRFLILRRPVLNLWSALPLAFVSGWLIVISGATFAELCQVAILNSLWVYLIVAASCYSYWAMHIGYKNYCICRLTEKPAGQTVKPDQLKVGDRSEEVSGYEQAYTTGTSISQVVEKNLDKMVHKKYQPTSDVNIQGAHRPQRNEGMEDEQVNHGRLTDEPAGQSGKQDQPKVKDRSVAIICAIFVAIGIYLVLRDSQSQPTSQPDVEKAARQTVRQESIAQNAPVLTGEKAIGSSLPARHSLFVLVKLPLGVSIEVPKNWRLLDGNFNTTIETAGEAALNLAGIKLPTGQKVNLFRANSNPSTTYAGIAINATDSDISPTELLASSEADIRELAPLMHQMFDQGLATQNLRVIQFDGIRREIVDGHPSLVIEYVRSGPKGPVVMQMTRLFIGDKEISLNLSYRQSETGIWKPIVDHMRSTFRVSRL